MFLAPLTALLLQSAAADEVPAQPHLPEGVRAMIEAAIARGDAKAVEVVVALARETHPSASGEIDTLLIPWRTQLAAAEALKAAPAQPAPASGGLLDNWKGQVEAGASRSTGRTSYLGAVGSISIEQDGTHWRNKINGRLEVQKGRNVTSVERFVASWQPNYKFDDDLYAYGLTQLESDTSQAYRRRYTASGGFGYGVLKTPGATLELEGGPAFRRVAEAAADAPRSSLAARASMNFRWALAPTLELKQASSFFLEPGNRNATAVTSIDAQILGPLKARFSYDLRYEDRPSEGGSHLDTLSRATLVYSF